MHYHYKSSRSDYGYKTFSLSSGSFSPPMFAYPGYPSYLPGVDIFKLDGKDMPQFVLGFTNGKFIALRRGLKNLLLEFVQLHEEEHVKDMHAAEKEIDKRALQRLLARHPAMDAKKLKAVKRLLHRRWHNLVDFAFADDRNFFYKSGGQRKEKKKIFEKESREWFYGEGYF